MFQRGALPADVNICGYARSSMHTSALLAQLGPHLRRSKGTDALFERFASRLSYVTGQYAALSRAAEPLTDIASQFAAAPLHDGFGDGSVASRLHAATLPELVGCAVVMRSQAANFGLNSLNRIPFPSTFTREECIGRRYDSATSLRELDRFLGTLETGVANRLYALHHPPSPSRSPTQPPPAPEIGCLVMSLSFGYALICMHCEVLPGAAAGDLRRGVPDATGRVLVRIRLEQSTHALHCTRLR